MGRPVLYETAEELQRIIELYFLACRTRETGDTGFLTGLSDEDLLVVNDVISSSPTVSGLAYTLGMTTETLRAYGEKEEFSATIKRAKQRIEAYLEERLYGNSPTGTIFNLKNNFGWKDKQETELSGPDGGAIKTDNKFIVEIVSADK